MLLGVFNFVVLPSLRENGQRFRDMILSKGHTEDYGTMFRAFYGKDPDIGPMLEHRGLTLR